MRGAAPGSPSSTALGRWGSWPSDGVTASRTRRTSGPLALLTSKPVSRKDIDPRGETPVRTNLIERIPEMTRMTAGHLPEGKQPFPQQ